MESSHLPAPLAELATHYGIVTSYHDINGSLQRASIEGVTALLAQLGAAVRHPDDATQALLAARASDATRLVEPVTVVWQPNTPRIAITRHRPLDREAVHVRLDLEDGTTQNWNAHLGDLGQGPGGRLQAMLELPELPLGRHRVSFQLGREEGSTWLLHAPAAAWPSKGRCWGLFAPTYAVRQTGFGTGTLSDLGALTQWTAGKGGGFVGTLPLLPTYLDDPYDPSPYAPISRLFWSEFYLDLAKVAEQQHCPNVAVMLSDYSQLDSRQGQSPERLIDSPPLAQARQRILRDLSVHFFSHNSSEREHFERFVRDHPEVEPYARFRATMSQKKSYFRHWSGSELQQLRGQSGPMALDPVEVDCHRYAQWRAHEQLVNVAHNAREAGAGLYLDLPVGTHPNGFDAWYHDQDFLAGSSAGAPPDPFFSKGQNWGFAPLNPDTIRQTGYAHVQACLRHHMQVAEILRIDHVMGLHRIYCIPNGMAGSEGAYVRFRAPELYALVALESERYRCTVVGEDLGTVPPEVRTEMEQRGLLRMYVAQFSLHDTEPHLAPVPAQSLASLNTHDTPPFAAYVRGLEIDDRVALGASSTEHAEHEHRVRQHLVTTLRQHFECPAQDDAALLHKLLQRLAASDAPYLLVSLEDLWLETAPQNVPGTLFERPNWRRRMAHALDTLEQHPGIMAALHALTRPNTPSLP